MYGDAAVAFLISRVGNSQDARVFLDELRRDKKIGGMVYCSPEDMEEKQAIFQKCKDDAGYSAWVSSFLPT